MPIIVDPSRHSYCVALNCKIIVIKQISRYLNCYSSDKQNKFISCHAADKKKIALLIHMTRTNFIIVCFCFHLRFMIFNYFYLFHSFLYNFFFFWFNIKHLLLVAIKLAPKKFILHFDKLACPAKKCENLSSKCIV